MSSKEVEQKVLEMRFDNRNFEKNVSETMTTLQKLKAALKFDKSSDGIDNIGKAANRVSFRGMEQGIEHVRGKFSALEVASITAVANISNSLVNAGKRMAKAFTIEPVTTGFAEYELKMGSVQTIMMSTGESLEKVNGYLDELNTYSDKTIYSFQDMTSNIGKFTNAGVKLDDAVKAIQGISNEAAVSGANAQEASRAMYNFAQALSAGYVKLIDWKSIENANMATVEFKQQLIDTAERLGTLKKTADGFWSTGKHAISATHEFNDSLSDQWMTTDVLVQTLNDYASTETKIGQKAFQAAQEVKTFSMMMDTLKEAAQSGWAATWELIVGDYEQSKALWTKAADFFGGVIDSASDARNELFKGALENVVSAKDWKQIEKAGIATYGFKKAIMDAAKAHGIAMDDMIAKEGNFVNTLKHNWLTKDIISDAIKSMSNNIGESTKTASDKLTDFRNMVNRLTNGDWGDSAKRKAELKKAGADYKNTIRDVNEELIATNTTIKDLSVEQMRNAGFTNSQIKEFYELSSILNVADTPLNKLMDDLERPTGRELLIEAATRAGHSLQNILGALGKAWRSVFPKTTSDQLYGFINGVNELTKFFEINDKEADKLQRTFRGVFSILGLIKDIIMVPVKIAFNGLQLLMGQTDGSILDMTASVGDSLTAFSSFARGLVSTGDALKYAKDLGNSFLSALKDLYSYLDGIPEVHQIFEDIKSLPEGAEKVGEYIIAGFKKGMSGGFKELPAEILKIGKKMLTSICDLFIIRSPSRKWAEIGKYTIQGWLKGISSSAGSLVDKIKDIGSDLIDAGSEVNFDKVFKYGVSTATIASVTEFSSGVLHLSKAFDNFTAPAKGVGEVLSSVSGVIAKSGKSISKTIKAFSKVLTGFSWALKGIAFRTSMEGLKQLSVAMLLLVGAVGILTLIDSKKLPQALIDLGIIAGILTAMGTVFMILNKINSSLKIDKNSLTMNGSMFGTLIGIGTAMLLISATVKKLGSLSPEQAEQGFKGLAKVMIAIGALVLEFSVLQKINDKANIASMGGMMLGIAGALLTITVVIKAISRMEPRDIAKGLATITAISLLFGGLIALTHFAKNDMKAAGTFLLAASGSMLILTVVMKKLASISWPDLSKGMFAISAFAGVITYLIMLTHLADKEIPKVTGMLLGISAAIYAMGLTIELLAALSVGDITKGVVAISLFAVLINTMTKSLKKNGSDTAKVALEMVGFSAAIGILAATAYICGQMNPKTMIKGITCVAILGEIVKGMTNSLKGANDIKGTMIAMSVAIAVMVGSAILLSTIETKKLAKATAALSVMMLSFSQMIRFSQQIEKGSIKRIVTMSTIVIIMAGIVTALSHIDNIDGALQASLSITALMAGMSAAMYATQKAPNFGAEDAKKLLMMELLIGSLGVVLAGIQMMNIDLSLKTVGELTGVMMALTGCAIAMSYFNKNSKPTGLIAGVAVLAAMELLFLGLGKVFEILSGMKINVADTTIKQMVGVLTAMTALAAVVTLLGKVMGIGGETSLAFGAIGSAVVLGVIAAMEGLFLLLGKIFEIISGLKIDNTKIDAMITCAENWVQLCMKLALLGTVGALALVGIGAFDLVIVNTAAMLAGLGALTDKFPQLEKFIKDGIPLLNTLGQGIGEFFGTLVASFSDKATEGLPKIADHLSEFADNLKPFLDTMSTVDKDMAAAVKSLASALLIITGADLLAGLTSFITGSSSYENFSTGAEALANGLTSFSNNLPANLKVKTVAGAAKAVGYICEAADKIPNSGGMAGLFAGENDMGVWAGQLGLFGAGIALFSEQVDGKVKGKSVQAACKAGTAICEMADKIPNEGGALAFFTGDNDIMHFAGQLGLFGAGIAQFSTQVAGKVKTKSVANATKAAEMIILTASRIPNSGGMLSYIVGDNNMGDFADDLGKFGLSVALFSAQAAFVKADKIAAVVSAIIPLFNAVSTLPTTGGIMDAITGSKGNLSDFSDNLVTFGEGIKDFANEIDEVSIKDVQPVVQSFADLMNACSKLDGVNVKDVESKIEQLATKGIKGFTDTFSNDMNSAIALMAWSNNLIKILGTYVSNFESAGKNCAQGFINGIKTKVQNGDVSAAGKSIGDAAYEAARKALDEHSPSKKMQKIGEYASEGLAIGITKSKNDVVKASKDTANSASLEATKAFNGHLKNVKKASKTAAKETSSTVNREAKGINNTFTKGILGLANSVAEGTNAMNRSIGDGILGTKSLLGRNVVDSIVDAGKKAVSTYTGIGTNSALAFTDGLNTKSVEKKTKEAAKKQADTQTKTYSKQVAKNVKSTTKHSDVMKSINDWIAKNPDDSASKIVDVFKTVAKEMTKAISAGLKLVKSSNAGKAAISKLEKNFIGAGKTHGRVFASATKIVKTYAKHLYKTSDYYKADQKELKADRKELNKLYRQKTKLYDELKKSKNSGTVKSIKKQIADINKQISDANKKIIKDQETVKKHTLQTFKDMTKSIRETVSAYLDLGSVSFDTDISPFEKFTSVNQDKIDRIKTAKDDKKEADKQVKQSEKELNKSRKNQIKAHELRDEALRKWKEAQKKAASLGGRSKVANDEVKEAYEEYKRLDEKLKEANADVSKWTETYNKSLKNAAKADKELKDAQKYDPVDDYLKNMKSQYVGNKRTEAQLRKLKKRLGPEYVSFYRYLSTQSADVIADWFKTTDKKLINGGKMFNKQGTIAGETYLRGFRDHLDKTNEFSKAITDITSSKYTKKLGPDLVDQIVNYAQSAGIEEGGQFLQMILGMDDKELKELKKSAGKDVKQVTDSATSTINAAMAKAYFGTTKEGKKLAKSMAKAAVDGVTEYTYKTGSIKLTKGGNKAGRSFKSGVVGVVNKKTGQGIASNLVSGIVNEVKSKKSKAKLEDAGFAVGVTMLRSTNNALGIHSPSREFAKIGRFSILGLAKGMDDNRDAISKTADDMSKTATDSFRDALNTLTQLQAIDLDSLPTIRPILDLSDVEDGLETMRGMFTAQKLNVGNVAAFTSDLSRRTLGNIVIQNDGTDGETNVDKSVVNYNTFNITSSDPKAAAEEVSKILGKQKIRRDVVWDS